MCPKTSGKFHINVKKLTVNLIFAGGAAWLVDSANTLDVILVNDGAHLVLNSSTNVSYIIGDGRSMVHFAPETTVTLGNDMTTHCFVYEDAVLNLTTASVAIGGYLFVKGRLDSTPDAVVTLSKPATVYLETQDIHISVLVIEEEASMSVSSINDTVFNFTIENFEVYGDFRSGPIDFFNITNFIVGAAGNVEFDPVDEDEYLGENIEIRGTVTLDHAVSFSNPCTQVIIDNGHLNWDISNSPNVTIECDRVVINGPFSAGNVNFGDGIGDFSVGNNGTFTLTAIGPVYMNSISIAGTVYFKNYAEIKSKNGTDGKIDYVIIHSPKGKLYLNNNDQPGYDINGTETNVNCSILNAENVIIDGVFSADDLDIGVAGIESFSVNGNGDFTFTPCGDFKIHELYVNGTMTSSIPLTLKGTSIERAHDFTIDTHGTVKFDNDVLSTKTWTGTSRLGIHNVEVYGIFHAGRMENRIAVNGSWDSLSVAKGGKFYFEPDGPFILDYMSVNGDFRAYTPIDIFTMRPEKDLIISVGSTGAVRFDSLISSGWTNLSTVTAQTLQTSSSSYFSAGDTKFDLQSLSIGGSFYAYPSQVINAAYFEVTNTGSADISRTVNIEGQEMSIAGTLDVSYQHDPEDSSLGCNATRVIYDDISVSGTFRAGSIQVDSHTLSVSGTMDVSGGGYLSDTGPGKRIHHGCPCKIGGKKLAVFLLT